MMMRNTTLFFALALLNSLSSYAQNERTATRQKKFYHETIDDPYLPNAYNNQKTSPGYKYNSNIPELPSTASTIFTIQVNVDGNGQNILGDAANEPSITVNPVNSNEIAIGWRQFDNVFSNFRQAGWAFSTNAGTSWTFPGTIETGIFRSDPVLDYNSNGIFYYNSLTSSFACKVFISTDGGATWDSGTDIGGGDKQWMTIDRTTGVGSGNIYSSWTSFYGVCPPGFFTRSSDGGASYESCTVVDGAPFWLNMTVGTNGELYIAGADTVTYEMLVVKSLNAQIPASSIVWNTPVPVNLDGYFNGWISVNPAGLLGMANIDVDRSTGPGQGNVYVLASVTRLSNSDPGDVMFSGSTDGGLTWNSPQRINDDVSVTNTQWFGTMSVAPNGRIDVVWLDTRDDQSGMDSSALYYSYSVDQGNTWSTNEKVSPLFDPHVGYPNQNKMGDYFDMISDNGGAHLSWANTLNGEQDVYYSRIIPSVVGVNEIFNNFPVSIFPNPTSGKFQIQLATGNWQLASSQQPAANIEICNVYGEKVYSSTPNLPTGQADSKLTTLNLSSLPSGVYFVKIQSGEKIHTSKVVIQKSR